MFLVRNNVPEVYIQESRDFQLFAELYDLAIQSSRFSIDSLEEATSSIYCNSSILPLLATKVGLFEELNLPDIAYRKAISAFPHIMRHKGSMKGIQLIANLFERLSNTSVIVDRYKDLDNGEVSVKIQFIDYSPSPALLNLLTILLEHVRPTGLYVLIEIVNDNFDNPQTSLGMNDSVKFYDVTKHTYIGRGVIGISYIYRDDSKTEIVGT